MRHVTYVTLFAIALIPISAISHDKSDHRADKQRHAAEIGTPGNPAKVSRVVEIEMNDTMRFKPAHININRGETIKFVVKNKGKLRHEMVLGSAQELKAHAELMRKFPAMMHADPNQVSVDPGKTGELIWHFTHRGRFDFACLQPGHFEAGMTGEVDVKLPATDVHRHMESSGQ